jgi:hypothetical protein
MATQQSQQKPEVVVLNWKTASNSVLNGKGNWFNGGRLTQLVIQSKFVNGQLRRPQNFTFKNWKINGSIRVLGVGSSASNAVKQSSFSLGHTRRMQAAAPTGITFSGLKIKANEKIPLIVGPGATGVTLSNSQISGTSQSVAIYLDAESANHSIVGNTFRLKADRELIAVDGSKGNLIADNKFNRLPWGYWEKNPKNGRQFEYRYGVWLGSRDGSRAPSYCGADKGYPFGSSVNNGDFANDNIVSGNRRMGSGMGYLLEFDESLGIGGYNKFIQNDGKNNKIISNGAHDPKARRQSQSSRREAFSSDARLQEAAVAVPGSGSQKLLPRPFVSADGSCGCSTPAGFAGDELLPGVA